jgi:hypothetical protein
MRQQFLIFKSRDIYRRPKFGGISQIIMKRNRTLIQQELNKPFRNGMPRMSEELKRLNPGIYLIIKK